MRRIQKGRNTEGKNAEGKNTEGENTEVRKKRVTASVSAQKFCLRTA